MFVFFVLLAIANVVLYTQIYALARRAEVTVDESKIVIVTLDLDGESASCQSLLAKPSPKTIALGIVLSLTAPFTFGVRRQFLIMAAAGRIAARKKGEVLITLPKRMTLPEEILAQYLSLCPNGFQCSFQESILVHEMVHARAWIERNHQMFGTVDELFYEEMDAYAAQFTALGADWENPKMTDALYNCAHYSVKLSGLETILKKKEE